MISSEEGGQRVSVQVHGGVVLRDEWRIFYVILYRCFQMENYAIRWQKGEEIRRGKERENALFASALILEQPPGEIPEIWRWMERKGKEREKQRDADSVRRRGRVCERDADKRSMHSGQIFTCWVTFCIKLMYNWWKAFIPMSIGTVWPELNGVICSEWWRTRQKDLKLYVRKWRGCFLLSQPQISAQNGVPVRLKM